MDLNRSDDAMKLVIAACAALALGVGCFVYAALNTILDEDWQPNWEEWDRE
jgi:hypothetical protein